MKKTREQTVSDNIWGSPALFITAAFICFNAVRGDEAELTGWIVYACGWIPALAMLTWCALKRRRPGVGGVVSFLMLLLFGGIFWLTHG